MATRYVKSTGSGTTPYDTWAKAATTVATIATADTAGDSLYVDSAQSETSAASLNHSWAGTLASPTRLLSVNSSAEPPTALAAGATCETTGASNLNITGHCYVYGFTYRVADSTNSAQLAFGQTTGSNRMVFQSCNFELRGSGSTSTIYIGYTSGAGPEVHWRDCTVKFANAAQGIQVQNGVLYWHGGSIASGSTSPTTLFLAPSNRQAIIEVSGVDLSNGGSSMNLFTGTNIGLYRIVDSTLPASWSGDLLTGTLNAGVRAEMFNCDVSGSTTNYRMWIKDAFGSAISESGIYLDGGEYDGTTRVCDKIATTSSCNERSGVFNGPDMESAWIDTTGSSKTLTVEFIHGGSALLTDAEIWLEALCREASSPLGTWKSDRVSDVLATGTAQTASTSTWSATAGAARANSTAYSLAGIIDVQGGLWVCTTAGTSASSEPAGYATGADGDSVTDGTATFRKMYRQKLSVSFTPQQKGTALGRVVIGKASLSGGTAVYVDPNLTVT